MANDCLVTKLKVAVSNDNLPKLGQLVLKVQNLSDLTLRCSGSTKIKLVGDGYINSVGTKEVSNPADPHITAVDAKLFIDDKYSIRTFGSQTSLVAGEIQAVSTEELKYFSPNLVTLHVKGWAYGSILNVAHYISTNIISFSGSGEGITGRIEDFATKMLAAGRTSGTMELDLRSCPSVTLNSVSFGRDLDLIFNGSNITITANGAPSTVYATYNGSTWTYNS